MKKQDDMVVSDAMMDLPDYAKSKYSSADPNRRLTEDAPDCLKRKFEKEYSSFFEVFGYDENGEAIEDPYYTREGKVISKKRRRLITDNLPESKQDRHNFGQTCVVG